MDFDKDDKDSSSDKEQGDVEVMCDNCGEEYDSDGGFDRKGDVEVCDNCGEEFDSDGGDDRKAELPCKCRLHEYSCLMKRNK